MPPNQRPKPVLSMTPEAYLQWLWYAGNLKTEIFMFGMTPPDNPLLIDRLYIPKQEATSASVEVDSEDHQQFILRCVDEGLQPHQFTSIFLHTHPGRMGTSPSHTDWEEFNKFYSHIPHAVMGILNGEGEYTVVLRLNRPELKATADIDCSLTVPSLRVPDFWECVERGLCEGLPPLDPKVWKTEADQRITEPRPSITVGLTTASNVSDLGRLWVPDDSYYDTEPNVGSGVSFLDKRSIPPLLHLRPRPERLPAGTVKPPFFGIPLVVTESYAMNGEQRYSTSLPEFLNRHAESIAFPASYSDNDNPAFAVALRSEDQSVSRATYEVHLIYYRKPAELGKSDPLHYLSFTRLDGNEIQTLRVWARPAGKWTDWNPVSSHYWDLSRFQAPAPPPDVILVKDPEADKPQAAPPPAKSRKARRRDRKLLQGPTP